MYEFTRKGLWFRWSALDRRGKVLVGSSLLCSLLSAAALARPLGRTGYRVGRMLGSGGREPVLAPFVLQPWMTWWVLAFGTASILLWWRFSRTQNEMFNRVQNWALGMGAAWTAAALAVWAVLAKARVVPPVDPWPLIGFGSLAIVAFWVVAVRRWA